MKNILLSFSVLALLFSCSSDNSTTDSNSAINIDCDSASNDGFLIEGVSASNVSSEILYNDGDGGQYSMQSISSTNVIGLTANLSQGTFAIGSGILRYTITGTPDSAGVAVFDLNIGGQSCTLRFQVDAQPSIGETFQGGIVFYLNDNGGGLISAVSPNEVVRTWGCAGLNLNGANRSEVPELLGVGQGQANTSYIVNNCTTTISIAASYCDNLTLNGYSDWFLPSKEELNLMYENIGQAQGRSAANIGDFDDGFYWSSSELDDGSAWRQFFFNGDQGIGGKSESARVRAIRAF